MAKEGETKEVEVPDGFQVSETKEFKGLLADKTSETRRRQALEEDNSALQTQLNEANSRLAATSQPEGEPGDDTDPDDFPTFKDLDKVLDAREKRNQAAKQKESRLDEDRRFVASEQQAKTELTVKSQGEGLDFDSVIADGFRAMVKTNPAYMQVVMGSPNPAREAYEIGLRHPDVAARLETVRNAKLLEQINKNPTRVPGGGGSSEDSGPAGDNISALLQLPESELLKLVEDGGG